MFQDQQTLQTWIEELKLFSAAQVSDALGRNGAMSGISPLYHGARVTAFAYTVRCAQNDNLMCHYAVKFASPGEVLVVDAGDDVGAVWGELLSLSAKERGLAGIVLDGYSRDRVEIEALGFPVFARGVIPQGTFKTSVGSVQQSIVCGGITVNPGDIILGDDDGIVVVPREKVAQVIEAVRGVSAKEYEMRARIAGGEVMYDFLGLEEVVARNSFGNRS